MNPTLIASALTLALAAHTAISLHAGAAASWLDEPKPASWNTAGLAIPAAPKVEGPLDSRCRDQARPPQTDEDSRVRDRGWDLIDAFQGGWQVLIIRGTAAY